MSVQPSPTPIQFTLPLNNIPETIHQEAEANAKEAYVMTLLQHGIISSGRAARILNIPRLDVIERMEQYGICVFAPQTQTELEQEIAETKTILKSEVRSQLEVRSQKSEVRSSHPLINQGA